MSKLIEMLEELVDTMSSVTNKNLEMDFWYSEDKSSPCGYAACICGEQALKKNTDIFKLYSNEDVACYSSAIAMQLNEAARIEYNNSNIARSIYITPFASRHYCANESGLFSYDEIVDFKHLSSNNPTPQDAIVYITAVIEKLRGIS